MAIQLRLRVLIPLKPERVRFLMALQKLRHAVVCGNGDMTRLTAKIVRKIVMADLAHAHTAHTLQIS